MSVLSMKCRLGSVAIRMSRTWTCFAPSNRKIAPLGFVGAESLSIQLSPRFCLYHIGSSWAITRPVYFNSRLVVGCCRPVTWYFYSSRAVLYGHSISGGGVMLKYQLTERSLLRITNKPLPVQCLNINHVCVYFRKSMGFRHTLSLEKLYGRHTTKTYCNLM